MAKKRKALRASAPARSQNVGPYDPEETFNDSEDEFFMGREKILLEEEPAAKRRRRLEEEEAGLQPSDEEIYEQVDSEDEAEDDQEEADEEDENNWGTSKSDYYNADVLETEADALEEEREARRLQQKQLKGMTAADFGFDESAWADDSHTKEERSTVEKLPELQVPENASADDRLRLLKSRYPEFEPLTKDFLALQETHQKLKAETETADGTVVKYRALSAYLASVAMYLAILTSSKTGMALAPAELREHPVMTNLMQCRQLWQEAESLQPIKVEVVPILPPAPVQTAPPPPKKKKKKKKKVKASKEASPEPPPVSTKREGEKKSKPKLNELEALLAASMKPVEAESDFGDEDALTQEEAAEKARRKKSLRFYTSQITQKANKRGEASRQAGGDDDLPYKERMRDRQERLMREAAQKARSQANEDEKLTDNDDAEDESRPNRLQDDGNEYYNMLVSNSKQKKADKSARAEAYAEAARQGAQVFEEEQIGKDGKRKITYAIEKNKGLQPKRKKDVRNPRVKKRKKYDEKMKKLGSMRAVYKGGEGRGGYGGEATGIKANLVKSIKL